MWSITIPPKVRIFWWKVAHDIIPTEKTYQGIMSQFQTFACFAIIMTIHALFKCSVAKALWKYWDSKDLFQPIQGYDIVQVLWWLMENLNKWEFEEVGQFGVLGCV